MSPLRTVEMSSEVECVDWVLVVGVRPVLTVWAYVSGASVRALRAVLIDILLSCAC